MTARGLLNLALVAVAIGLAALIWYRPGLEHEAAPPPITTIDPGQVASIDLTRTAAEPLVFHRQAGHWVIDGTPAIPADDFQVNTVLALLQARGIRRYQAATMDLNGLGLDPPQASVHFDATQINIGTTEAIEGLRYVKLGATVYLIEDRYQHLLNAGLGNFAQRRLLPDGAQITALQLPGLALTQTNDTHWLLTPEHPGTGADDINQLVQNWQHASALYVRRYESGGQADTVTVTLRDAGPISFVIVARDPDLVLARPDWGIQYHLTGAVGAGLLALPEPASP